MVSTARPQLLSLRSWRTPAAPLLQQHASSLLRRAMPTRTRGGRHRACSAPRRRARAQRLSWPQCLAERVRVPPNCIDGFKLGPVRRAGPGGEIDSELAPPTGRHPRPGSPGSDSPHSRRLPHPAPANGLTRQRRPGALGACRIRAAGLRVGPRPRAEQVDGAAREDRPSRHPPHALPAPPSTP